MLLVGLLHLTVGTSSTYWLTPEFPGGATVPLPPANAAAGSERELSTPSASVVQRSGAERRSRPIIFLYGWIGAGLTGVMLNQLVWAAERKSKEICQQIATARV
jgi:hypothetical protein